MFTIELTKDEVETITKFLKETHLQGNFLGLKDTVARIASILIKIEKASGNKETGSDTIINKVANE